MFYFQNSDGEKKYAECKKETTPTDTVLVSTANKPLTPPAEETLKMRMKSPADFFCY